MRYRGIDITVVQADALGRPADVLVLKWAQSAYGVDKKVVSQLDIDRARFPPPGGQLVIDQPVPLACRHLVFLGVEPLMLFGYASIRDFARRALAAAAELPGHVRTVAVTLHGAGFGLDEIEAFESEVAGLRDAIDSGACPRDLAAVEIVELDANRADRIRTYLDALSAPASPPQATVTRGLEVARDSVDSWTANTVGYDSARKPHAFVAMPFAESFNDVFHYGIILPIRAAGLLCERIDNLTFTGDVVAHMKERIASATLVVADLTDANPNVYLEVGYAWGVAVPCVLICNRKTQLKFDLQGHRALFYSSIMELEQLLTTELASLSAQSAAGQLRP